MAARSGGDDPGERRFSASRRAPKDERRNLVGFDPLPQGRARSEYLGLAYELREVDGSYAVGERRAGRRPGSVAAALPGIGEKLELPL